MYLNLIPAYGRDYNSAKAVLADWNAEKDFQICDYFNPDDGKYINKQQVEKGTSVSIRYGKKRKVKVFKV